MATNRDVASLIASAQGVSALTGYYDVAIRRILDQLAAGISRPGAARAAALLRDLNDQIDKLDPKKVSFVRNWIRREIPRAFVLGDRTATQDLRKQLEDVASGKREEFGDINRTFNGTNQVAMKAIMFAMEDRLGNVAAEMRARLGLIVRRTQQTLVTEQSLRDTTVSGILRGAAGRSVADDIAALLLKNKISPDLKKRLNDVGFRADMFDEFERVARGELITVGNRRMSVRAYADLVARTQAREAVTVGTVVRLQQNGVDHVQVSKHVQKETDVCTPFAGRVFYIGALPEDPLGFPSMRETLSPPYHPNCRHTLQPFVTAFKSEDAIAKQLETSNALPRKFFGKTPSQIAGMLNEMSSKEVAAINLQETAA